MYVLARQKSAQGDAYQQVTFSAPDLAPYVGERLTLDFIDSRNGSWGWNALDTVVVPGSIAVPEPATASLAILGIVGLAARRRRSA